ncbi:MAG: hypothetical protein K2F86_08145 [Duncaniella sp.]|nr:hypothetical protein [Duncaniella sp.]
MPATPPASVHKTNDTPAHPMAIEPGKQLGEGKYVITIKKLLGCNAQGFTYRATARTRGPKPTGMEVVVREFFMSYCSERGADGLSVATPEDIAPTVEKCKDSFRLASEERKRISDNAPSLINVLDTFEANGTAYYVVEWLSGETLEEYVDRRGPLTLDETRHLLGPIFRAVANMHIHNALHTNIYPGHIRFTRHGNELKPVLFSLYSTMHFDEEGTPLWMLQECNFRTGYAAPEQYREINHFLPQTDIYALAAVTVFCLSGKQLPDSRSITEDDVRRTLPPALPETYASALIHALATDVNERTESVTGVFDDMKLTYGVDQRAVRPDSQDEVDDDIHTPDRTAIHRRPFAIMALVTLLALIALIAMIVELF